MIGDNRYFIIRRLVQTVNGNPQPGDLETDLLEKYLVAISGTPSQGDSFMNLLAKIVTLKGGTPRPGDNEWNLLVKWLEAEGQCMCNGLVIDFWRKLLETTDTCGAQPTNVVLVQVGPGGPFNISASSLIPGVQYMLARSINGAAFADVGTEDGNNFPMEGFEVGVANGDSVRFSLRRVGTNTECQVISNAVIASGF